MWGKWCIGGGNGWVMRDVVAVTEAVDAVIGRDSGDGGMLQLWGK